MLPHQKIDHGWSLQKYSQSYYAIFFFPFTGTPPTWSSTCVHSRPFCTEEGCPEVLTPLLGMVGPWELDTGVPFSVIKLRRTTIWYDRNGVHVWRVSWPVCLRGTHAVVGKTNSCFSSSVYQLIFQRVDWWHLPSNWTHLQKPPRWFNAHIFFHAGTQIH